MNTKHSITPDLHRLFDLPPNPPTHPHNYTDHLLLPPRPSLRVDEDEARRHAHDAVMVPGMEAHTPGAAADGPGSDKKASKKKTGARGMLKNSPASALNALAALGYRPSPAKPVSSPPRKGSFVAQLAAGVGMGTGADGGLVSLGAGSGLGLGTPFASAGVQGTMALTEGAHLQGQGLGAIVSSGRSSEGDARSGSTGSQGGEVLGEGEGRRAGKHQRRKRVGSVTFGDVDVAGGGLGDSVAQPMLVPPLLLPSDANNSPNNGTNNNSAHASKENLPNMSLSTKEKKGITSTISFKLKRKPSAQGSGIAESQGPDEDGSRPPQQQLVSTKSSKSMRNLFGGLKLRRVTMSSNPVS